MQDRDDVLGFTDKALHEMQLATLLEASKQINATLDLEALLKCVLALIAYGVDAELAVLYLADEEDGEREGGGGRLHHAEH